MYCRISPLAFSMAPFCHDEYGSVKYTLAPIASAIFLCAANSLPLSVVIVRMLSLKGFSISMTTSASSLESFPCFNFSMNSLLVFLSIRVTIACWLFGPTIVSISKSPNRFPSASLGLSSMPTLSGIWYLPAAPIGLLLCLSLCRRCLYRVPLFRLSILIHLYIVSCEILKPSFAR